MNSKKLQNSWWPEKYRPQTLEELVGNEGFIDKAKHWIETQDVPNLILHSSKSGTGKTSACRLIAKLLDADVKYINASDENSIDTVRDVIKTFAATSGFSKWKIVILDEFSYFSTNAQSALLAIIESSSAHTRFFLTGNYIDKFLPAIISRCHPFEIQSPPPKKIFENLPRGNKHPNWKGGITSLTMRIRSSFKNRQWRSDVFTRDDYTCQMCGARNGCGKAVYLEADHYPKMFSEIFQEYKIKTIEQAFACEEFWNINNGRTLCRDCHDKTKSKSWRRFADIATNENVLFKR